MCVGRPDTAPAPEIGRQRPAPAVLCLLLVAVPVLAYIPLRHNGFVDFDDEVYITANEHVRQGLTADNVVWAWTTRHGAYWQPLSWLSLQWDAHWFSSADSDATAVPSAFGFHVHSLGWHLASTVSLFWLLLRLTGATWRSFLVAALFAVHPLRVESVAWAAERKDVLCGFFGILALHAYLWYCGRPSWRRYLAVMAASATSLMCKPMLMTLPAVLLLLDVWPLRRCGLSQAAPTLDGSHVALWRLIAEKIPLALLAATIGVVTVMARAEAHASMPLDVLPLGQRLANLPVAYAWYVVHTVYPVELAVLYPHPGPDWSLFAAIGGTLLLIGVTAISFWQVRRRPWLLVGWLWFVGTLLPVSGLAQGGEQAWADRFTYWPQIGLLVLGVWGLSECAERLCIPYPARTAVGVLAIAACGFLTWRQVGYWRNTETLWERALSVTERNHRAHLNLGKWYLDRGELGHAVPHLETATRLRPEESLCRYCLGLTYLLLGHVDPAAEQFQEAIRIRPAYTDAWYNLGMARLHQGRPELAVGCFRRTLALAPDQTDARTALGRALWRSGQRAEAVSCFQESIARNTSDAFAWEGIGLLHLAHGAAEQAVESLSRAVELQPDNQWLLSELGIALGRRRRFREAAQCQARAIALQTALEERLAPMKGRAPEPEGIAPLVQYECRLAFALGAVGDRRAAVAIYRSALQRAPDWPDKLAARAMVLATNPAVRDPHLARECALQVIEAVHGEAAHAGLVALINAHAASGRYASALASAYQALAVHDSAIAEALRKQRDHYEHGLPVTSDPH